MQITLSQNEKRLCEFIARERKQANRKVDPRDIIAEHGLDPWYVECEGVMSELAFCRAMDKYPDEIFEVGCRSAAKGEDRGDATINGICIDVKSTKYQSGQLLCVKRNPSIDLIVLMTGEKGCYRLAGGMWAEDMYEDWRYGTTDKIPYPCFKATQAELLPPKKVMEILNHTSFAKPTPVDAQAFDWTKP